MEIMESIKFLFLETILDDCNICYHENLTLKILPCHNTHRVCEECFSKIDKCPYCRYQFINDSNNEFIPELMNPNLELPTINANGISHFDNNFHQTVYVSPSSLYPSRFINMNITHPSRFINMNITHHLLI